MQVTRVRRENKETQTSELISRAGAEVSDTDIHVSGQLIYHEEGGLGGEARPMGGKLVGYSI